MASTDSKHESSETKEPQLRVLYELYGSSLVFQEVKRLDVPDNATPQDRYFWFVIKVHNPDGEPQRLTFKSMSSSESTQTRVFEEGMLVWDTETGKGSFTEAARDKQPSLALPVRLAGTVVPGVKQWFKDKHNTTGDASSA